jgi:hypothetical protein
MVEAGMAEAVPVEATQVQGSRNPPMTDPVTEITPEFQRGWDAALMAARFWHESQAKKALIQARRSRFPKNFEREAEVHQRSAEMITVLSPDDV